MLCFYWVKELCWLPVWIRRCPGWHKGGSRTKGQEVLVSMKKHE